jgi:hypothetical protein
MQNFRKKIEKTVIKTANLLQHKGIYKTIQVILYGNNRNVAPSCCKW